MPSFSLEARFAAVALLVALCAAAAGLCLQYGFGSWPLAIVAAAAVALIGASWAARAVLQPVQRLLRALESAVASYRDGDYSFSIASERGGPLRELAQLHNELGRTLREQRQHLSQRELLLDTVVQNTPTALMLVDDGGHVTYANLAARQLFNDGRTLAGLSFDDVIASGPAALHEALAEGGDALFSVDFPEGEESFHVSQRGFRLQGRAHRLLLFRRMTRELSRQEVVTWKKVIRVMSHELNNSLAPISSLSHSGAELARRGQIERLPEVFNSIGARARHLHGFIEGYATFARLPSPRLDDVSWRSLIGALQPQVAFRVVGEAPDAVARLDAGQIEQVLINLIKNAHEAGSAPDDIELQILRVGVNWRLELRDRGSGMSESVLANALLPFYSTKRAGTGLGLALAREIIEAHGGRLQLANRDGGGLRVSLTLPA
ncbi:sensor histidine kinase [Solimonas marina]|uniref:histidine kinase n=1 Tax=Solimonas marina TaxID=2714601 RepID=A0A970B620_9GAMM|nr:ATP-binding protein [Solimonas marina]NKF23992.1 PAS domain-containing protein [Solimonas marina]